jgi:hypothetical protein
MVVCKSAGLDKSLALVLNTISAYRSFTPGENVLVVDDVLVGPTVDFGLVFLLVPFDLRS